MGAYLSAPHTEIEAESGCGNGVQFAAGSMQVNNLTTLMMVHTQYNYFEYVF